VVRKWLIIVIEEKVMAGLLARDAGVDFAHFNITKHSSHTEMYVEGIKSFSNEKIARFIEGHDPGTARLLLYS
jgi:hypothetical protein